MTYYNLVYYPHTDRYCIETGDRIHLFIYREITADEHDDDFKRRSEKKFDEFIAEKKKLYNSQLVKSEIA